jgi:Tfp pilus assembly protein PilN
MIKINLLESITDRPTGVAMVEDKVASPRIQTLLICLTVFGLLFLGAGYDYISSQAAHSAAQAELAKQKEINQQMMAVIKEQSENEKKMQDIQVRIDAITKLREAQQGPGSVLREIKARFDSVPGLYLKSVEQKDGEITIKGESPNEASVTRFGQSLEFSSGLFTNLNIETQRDTSESKAAKDAPADTIVAKMDVINFTVKCSYNNAKAQPQPASPNAPNQQVAMKK